MFGLKRFGVYLFVTLSILALAGCAGHDHDSLKEGDSVTGSSVLTKKEMLGKLLFFETGLSSPPGQSCATCHDPELAFADPETGLPVSKGASAGLYGNRNDMPVAYAAFVPPLHFDKEEEMWVGGLFWDGRANSLAEQAQGPPLNPLEMANPDVEVVFEKLKGLDYAALFYEVYGPDALSSAAVAFDNMADAIEAFEKHKTGMELT